MIEPPPFAPGDGGAHPRRRRSGEPYRPLSQEDLDFITARPLELRSTNPWQCMYNLSAEDGVGDFSGRKMVQCSVRLADPTKSRYCIEHSRELGLEVYTPQELSEATDREVAGSLTRLVPKAVRTLEQVMDDEDAPAGIRSKAADSVLDRTGYAKGLDVRVEARVVAIDTRAILQERLDSLKDAQLKVAEEAAADPVVDETPAALPGPTVVPGVIMDRDDGNGDGAEG